MLEHRDEMHIFVKILCRANQIHNQKENILILSDQLGLLFHSIQKDNPKSLHQINLQIIIELPMIEPLWLKPLPWKNHRQKAEYLVIPDDYVKISLLQSHPKP